MTQVIVLTDNNDMFEEIVPSNIHLVNAMIIDISIRVAMQFDLTVTKVVTFNLN